MFEVVLACMLSSVVGGVVGGILGVVAATAGTLDHAARQVLAGQQQQHRAR